MQISVSIIFVVVVFLCLCSFVLGFGISFLLMARDKSLVRLEESQIIVEKSFFDKLVSVANQQKRNLRYDSKISEDDDD